MAVTQNDLAEVAALYDRGLYLQAYERSQSAGPLTAWRGTLPRLLAGRLAWRVGAHRLATALHIRAWRADPTDPAACCHYAYALFTRGRLLAAHRVLAEFRRADHFPTPARADCYALSARLAAGFRDFATAHQFLQQADALTPDNPRVWIQRAAVLDQEDRHADSLDALEHVLKLSPWAHSGVHAAARCLQHLNRRQEALEMLTAACARLESGDLLFELAELQRALGLYADARQSYDRVLHFLPLADLKYRQLITGRRSDAAYDCGDFGQAEALAREADTEFYRKVAANIANASSEDRRVMLAVGFVRQNHRTCAPATLTSISQYWSKPADHLHIAEKICFDGTPAHSTRRWAEQQGFHTREFTVTWEATTALIDRGIPFALGTTTADASHLQAVAGYDSRRRTLLIRDPSRRQLIEMLADDLFERCRSTGPSGLVLIPERDRDRLNGVELPDVHLYELLHTLNAALEESDRLTAQVAIASMKSAAATHRLTLAAARTLARFDSDSVGMLQACEQLLSQFPNDPFWQLNRLTVARDFTSRDERLRLLETICKQQDAQPVFLLYWADELSRDARTFPQASRLIHRALRARPQEARGYLSLARIYWLNGRFQDAWELYRMAACLDDREERYAQSFFAASRRLNLTEVALATLRDRFERFGKRSSGPARTLFWAYRELNRLDEGLVALQTAMAERPSNTGLKLFAAQEYGRYGRFAEARQILTATRNTAETVHWRRAAATVAGFEGDSVAELAQWNGVLEREPMAHDAHAAVARLLASSADREAAQRHLEQAIGRFPHNVRLIRTEVESMKEDDPSSRERVIRKLLAVNPVDGWARAQLVSVLVLQDRLDEALTESEALVTREPTHSMAHAVLAGVHDRAGRTQKARECNRTALRLGIDNKSALAALLRSCTTADERRAELAFVYGELLRQTVLGDSLLAYRTHARGLIEPKTLLANLQGVLKERPDLWECCSAVVQQLLEMNLIDEAKSLAKQARSRFPLVPAVLVDLAAVARAAGDASLEQESLEQAVQIHPISNSCVRRLATLYGQRGDLAAAKSLFERAVAQSPLDPSLHSCVAETLWRMKEEEAAVLRLQQTVKICPSYSWAWDKLREWGRQIGLPNAALDAARELCERSPGHPQASLVMFDAQLEDLDLPAAERTLQNLRAKSSGSNNSNSSIDAGDAIQPDQAWSNLSDDVVTRCVRLACLRDKLDEATSGLRWLCRTVGGETRSLSSAANAMFERHWHPAVEQVLSAALALPDADPVIAELWVESLVGQNAWKRCRKEFKSLRGRNGLWSRANSQFFELAINARKRREMYQHIRAHRAALSADDGSWAAAGRALTRSGAHMAAVRWFSDWRRRTVVPAWSLYSLATSHRYLRNDRAARDIHRHALTLPADQSRGHHAMALACLEIVHGNADRARELLSALEMDMNDWGRLQLALAHEALALVDAHPSPERPSYSAARRQLTERLSTRLHKIKRDPALRGFYHGVLRRIALANRSYAVAVWHWFQMSVRTT